MVRFFLGFGLWFAVEANQNMQKNQSGGRSWTHTNISPKSGCSNQNGSKSKKGALYLSYAPVLAATNNTGLFKVKPGHHKNFICVMHRAETKSLVFLMILQISGIGKLDLVLGKRKN